MAILVGTTTEELKDSRPHHVRAESYNSRLRVFANTPQAIIDVQGLSVDSMAKIPACAAVAALALWHCYRETLTTDLHRDTAG